jgi:hypothetical protein
VPFASISLNRECVKRASQPRETKVVLKETSDATGVAPLRQSPAFHTDELGQDNCEGFPPTPGRI